MIPFKATALGNTISFTVPSGYEDLTLGQYIDITKWDANNLMDLVQVMTGLKQEVIDNITEEEAMRKIVHLLHWATVPPVWIDKEAKGYEALPVQNHLTFNEKPYPVPQDIELESFGQKVSMQVHISGMQKNKKSVAESLPMAIAIYMQPVVKGGPFDEDKAKTLLPEILEMNLLEAYSVGAFFLNNLQRSLNGRSFRSRIKTMVTRIKRESRSSSRSGYSPRSTHSRRATSYNMTQSFYSRIGMSL